VAGAGAGTTREPAIDIEKGPLQRLFLSIFTRQRSILTMN
jgi:hypothetical protein